MSPAQLRGRIFHILGKPPRRQVALDVPADEKMHWVKRTLINGASSTPSDPTFATSRRLYLNKFMTAQKRLVSALWLALLSATVSAAETIHQKTEGFFDTDHRADRIEHRFTPGSGTAFIDITLSRPDGDISRTYKYDMSEINISIRAGKPGEIVILEGGSVGTNFRSNRYYEYDAKADDWVLMKRIIKFPAPGYEPATYDIDYFAGNTNLEDEIVTTDKIRTSETERGKNFANRLRELHNNLLTIYRNDTLNEASNDVCDDEKLAELMHNVPVSNETVEMYNNIGFFLGFIQDAEYCSILLLDGVIRAVPNRIPAHLNIADVYYQVGDNKNAMDGYKHYLQLMKQAGKQERVPPRVFERLEQFGP